VDVDVWTVGTRQGCKKMIGGGRTDHVAEGHCKGEGAGGGCAPSCAEREAPFYKVNGKLKRGSVLKSFYCLTSLYLPLMICRTTNPLSLSEDCVQICCISRLLNNLYL
jgi:hypothetical protein